MSCHLLAAPTQRRRASDTAARERSEHNLLRDREVLGMRCRGPESHGAAEDLRRLAGLEWPSIRRSLCPNERPIDPGALVSMKRSKQRPTARRREGIESSRKVPLKPPKRKRARLVRGAKIRQLYSGCND